MSTSAAWTALQPVEYRAAGSSLRVVRRTQAPSGRIGWTKAPAFVLLVSPTWDPHCGQAIIGVPKGSLGGLQ